MASRSKGGQHRCVLVMGTHDESNTVARTVLELEGFEVVTAGSGLSALALARSRHFDAVLLDLEGPDLDGIGLCQRLRAESGYTLTPMMVTTFSEDCDLWRRAFAAGCDDVLRKPLQPVVFRARLANLLQKAEYARDLERVRHNLSRYVSPRLRAMLQTGASGDCVSTPHEQEACILFSDIRGFTARAQTMQADRLFNAVSLQLGAQVESVYAHGGYVDKFGGDGIMAVFDDEDMATAACECALDIMRTTRCMASREVGPMPLGIGIHRGTVVAGNIGSGQHLDYTVIGNTVNLAARLCGFAGPMDIVVSQAVRDGLGEGSGIRCEAARSARIRGLKNAVTLYSLHQNEALAVAVG